MYRKIIHILLSVILLLSTMGVTISVHYCGNKLVSASMLTKVDACCNSAGGCCHTSTVHYEVKDDFVFLAKADIGKIKVIDLFIPDFTEFYGFIKNYSEYSGNFWMDTSPPPLNHELSMIQTFRC